MDDGDADECFTHTPMPWNLMLGYEKTDAIVHLCRKLSFFRRDRLTLSERELVLCSSGMDSASMDSLIIYGSVGSARNRAFLHLLRLARLTMVGDMASNVVVSPQVGDAVPNIMLYPLEETGQVRSHRRWNCVFWAIQCGMFRKIGRRRELVQQHVEEIKSLAQGNSDFEFSKTDEIPAVHKEIFFHEFCSLLEVEQEQHVPLDLFHSACTEERVSIPSVVSNVPTLLVVWASCDSSSIQWLKKNIFSVSEYGEMKDCVKLLATYISSTENDPWLRTVMRFVKVPERSESPDQKAPHRIPKRSQIILINVDHDKNSALKSYQELLSYMHGWSSPEVSLMSLWAGSEGLRSEVASAFNVTQLPFFVVSTPTGNLERKIGEGRYPRFSFFSSRGEEESAQNASNDKGDPIGMCGSNSELLDWHAIEQKERKQISSSLSNFISSGGPPLRFEARVDRCYSSGDSKTSCNKKNLKVEKTSTVRLSGIISTIDILRIKDELLFLSRVKNFVFDVRVIEASAPILTELNPMTPTRYVYGTSRNVTCSECRGVVLIDDDNHFRCIHCDQDEGVICRGCFNDGKHPQHHILLRVPKYAETTLHLLWGCSNVEPLRLYYGKLLGNVSDTHIGVYCNSCAKLIQGKRWKCALCYEYDLCSQCDDKINGNESKKKSMLSFETSEARDATFGTAKPHSKDHFYLCIRRGCGTKGDNILKPLLALNPLVTLLS